MSTRHLTSCWRAYQLHSWSKIVPELSVLCETRKFQRTHLQGWQKSCLQNSGLCHFYKSDTPVVPLHVLDRFSQPKICRLRPTLSIASPRRCFLGQIHAHPCHSLPAQFPRKLLDLPHSNPEPIEESGHDRASKCQWPPWSTMKMPFGDGQRIRSHDRSRKPSTC